MKRFVCLVIIGMSSVVFGQQAQMNDSLARPLMELNKPSFLSDFSLKFYVRTSLDSYFDKNRYTTSRFNGSELRLDLSAKIHDKVQIRFRNRYTSQAVPGTLDRVNSNVDLAYVDIQALPKVNIAVGKLSADWGGYEYDLNAIEILNYNDILSTAENYMVGVSVAYKVNAQHRFNIQLLNASVNKLDQIGTFSMPQGTEESKTPFAFVGNWRGSFWKDKFQTSYSYSYFTQAKNKGMHYIALGNKYQDEKLTVMYDFQYSHDDLDKRKIITAMFAEDNPELAEQVSYIDHWWRVDYKVLTKLYFSLTLMTSNAYAHNLTAADAGTNHVRTSYGAIPMVQYRPFKKVDLRFFAAYVGRWYNYSSYAKEKLNQENYSTGRISVGLIAPLSVF